MKNRTLRVLLLEDLSTDQMLVKRQVLKFAPNCLFATANSKKSFEEQLNWASFDLILSDYNLPGYNGLEALLFVKESRPHTPFIFITGTLDDEEKVAQAILSGASGYILKKNLRELPEKLTAILQESEDRFQIAEAKEQEEVRKQRLMQKLVAKIKLLSDEKAKEELLRIAAEFIGEPKEAIV